MPETSSKVRVFVSSTCYDLVDLRTELRSYLEENAFSVALSEDPNSSFVVDPGDNSIASCLNNVESSDVVICILDRRYGPPLTLPGFEDRSATHAEVRKARDLKRPIFFFMREEAWQDYEQLKSNSGYKMRWVEPDNADRRKKWFSFVNEVVSLPKQHSLSNWCDKFHSSVDLKTLVAKRLLDHFPGHVGVLAMQPDRLVRIHFIHTKNESDGTIKGHFRNVGSDMALRIEHGFNLGENNSFVKSRAALGGQENIGSPGSKDFHYLTPRGVTPGPVLFCEYSNRFGDRYRVETLLMWTDEGYEISEEKFYVTEPVPLVNRPPSR